MVQTYHIKDGNLEIKEHENATIIKLSGWNHEINYENKMITLKGSVESNVINFACRELTTSLLNRNGEYKTQEDIFYEVMKHVEKEMACIKLGKDLDNYFKQMESKLIVFEIEATNKLWNLN